MAIRAASIWRAVIHAGSRAWMPYSPNTTSVPPFDGPCVRPRCVLRCLTLRGINISRSLRGAAPHTHRHWLPSLASIRIPAVELRCFVVLAGAALDVLLLGEESFELRIGFLDERRGLELGLGRAGR